MPFHRLDREGVARSGRVFVDCGVRASDGKLMFSYPNAANRTANVATPVYSDYQVFFASAYGTGGGLLNLTVQNGEVAATEGTSRAT